MTHRTFRPAIVLALGLLALPGVTHAELGGPIASVQVDRGRIGARMTSRALGGYRRHELTRANGGTVHELTNADGKVFAVTWAGPGKPDLRTLLGPYFPALQADAGQASGTGFGRTMHSLRRPPQVDRPGLKIRTAGHMGWFSGAALIPALAPAGFKASDLAVRP